MTSRHRALIVEDDRETAEELASIVEALDCEAVVLDNQRDALAALEREPICFALLDLEIKLTHESIRGTTEAGQSLVREVRRMYPDHTGGAQGCHRMPVIVVTGHAREVANVVELMKDGANDLIEKPLDTRKVSAGIRAVLERSGRASHRACAGLGPRSGETLLISLPGERHRRRTIVLLNGRSVRLTDRSLRVFLALVVARLSGTWVHKGDLGATDEAGFRGISVLRQELVTALGADVEIIGNDYHGNYRISVEVRIEECDVQKLREIGDHEIDKLVEALGAHREEPKV